MNKGLVRRTMAMGALIAAVIILMTTNFFIVAPGMIQQITSYLVYPILVMQRSCVTPVKAWFERRHTAEQYAAMLKQLEQEKQELAGTVIQLQSLLDYKADIQELVDFKQRYHCSQAFLAQVLVRNIAAQSHFFIVDAGASKGITKNMVAVYKNHLIGKVTEVYPYYCKVLLITDRACKVSAYCAGTKASGIYAGNNEDNKSTLLHVSHLATVEEGDMILSTGDGLVFPRGFALGTIKSYRRNDLLYDIVAEPMVNLREIDYCYLLQKGNETITYAPDVPLVSDQVCALVHKAAKPQRIDPAPLPLRDHHSADQTIVQTQQVCNAPACDTMLQHPADMPAAHEPVAAMADNGAVEQSHGMLETVPLQEPAQQPQADDASGSNIERVSA